MYITNTLADFLSSSAILADSIIYLSNLNTIIFSTSSSMYLDKEISDSLKDIINLYKKNSISKYISSEKIIPLIKNDTISNYKSQIILPIEKNDIVSGLIIFITDNRKYLQSNLNFAKTTKHFTEIFSDKKYL